jgi:DNA polymerase-3 subunit alpha
MQRKLAFELVLVEALLLALLVAYSLGITGLDPIEAWSYCLSASLNPERISMPDIDLDFDERRRGEMIRYATE